MKLQYTRVRKIYSSSGKVVLTLAHDLLGVAYGYKSYDPQKHVLRRYNGIAFDVSAIEEAVTHGAEYILVECRATGAIRRADIREFSTYGIAFDYGSGPQIVLPWAHWRTLGASGQEPQSGGKGSNAQGALAL